MPNCAGAQALQGVRLDWERLALSGAELEQLLAQQVDLEVSLTLIALKIAHRP